MNIFQQFIKSIYSPKDMALFRDQGIGKTIGYVFLLMFIATSITSFSLGLDLMKWSTIANEKITNELPDFQLKNGMLSSDLESPQIHENTDFTFIFDTTGQISIDDVKKYKNAFAILKEEIVVIDYTQTQAIPYSSLGDVSITNEMLVDLISKLDTIILAILPVLFIFFYLFQTSLKFIGISFLALLGLILIKQMNRTLKYSNLWILSAYAVTIPTLFFAITNALKIMIPFAFLLYWLTATIVLYLIIVEIPKTILPNDEQQPIE